ncbi:hypothetical protein ACFL5G_03505, partial [Candidatus Margulisiibacteriota bacterium]
PGFLKVFSYKYYNFFKILEPRISYFINVFASEIFKNHQIASLLFRKAPISLVLTSTIVDAPQEVILKLARENKIPVIKYQHGAYGMYFKHDVFESEDTNSDYVLMYGPAVTQQFENYTKHRNKFIPTGSPFLDQLKKYYDHNIPISTDSKKKAVYVIGNLTGNYRYLSFNENYPDNWWFHRIQKSIIDTLAQFHDWEIIIKLHPASKVPQSLIENYIKDNQWNHFKFEKNKNFATLLQEINDLKLIIVDLPSTTLLEALCTKSDIFVFEGINPSTEVDSFGKQLLGKRTFYSNDINAFIENLRGYLNNKYTKKQNNNEFLKQFGIYLNDNKSKERTLKFITNIINKNKQ